MPNGLLYSVSWDTTTKTLSFTDKAGNTIYSCVVDISPASDDDPTKPLYLLSKENGSTVELRQYGSSDAFEISTDGTTWETATKNSAYTLDTGEGLYVRAASARSSFPTVNTSAKMLRFLFTGTIEAWNNVNSVLSPDFVNVSDLTTVGTHCLRGLFSRKLNDSEYDTSLIKAPLFPSTTLSESCYQHCFYGCQALAQCANVSATTLAYRACRAMYYECIALTEAVLPPALTVSSNAYSNMFKGCTGLTSIREFPFTAVDSGISQCGEMFSGCTGLTVAPELKPTTIIATGSDMECSYYRMFYGCSSLHEVRIRVQSPNPISLAGWLYDVSATGNFYCDPNTSFDVDSASGIPVGWGRLPLS